MALGNILLIVSFDFDLVGLKFERKGIYQYFLLSFIIDLIFSFAPNREIFLRFLLLISLPKSHYIYIMNHTTIINSEVVIKTNRKVVLINYSTICFYHIEEDSLRDVYWSHVVL